MQFNHALITYRIVLLIIMFTTEVSQPVFSFSLLKTATALKQPQAFTFYDSPLTGINVIASFCNLQVELAFKILTSAVQNQWLYNKEKLKPLSFRST